ncbi:MULTISPECIES: TetR family transcriptional regulator [Amycolatopsis]|uniref:TetR family transcriptional regulator n=1 Tax=Amycolatopsis dongchuanensis TaxID=1070866 RepID=A0ABP9QJM7_9PSEU|nr:TetR family transcriptional regulator [Amycolatopsis sacchari]
MRDGEATRRRLLDAAVAEFAAHGVAGARVDRIAAAARANKAQLYAYFGSKEKLFDTVLWDRVERNVDSVPLTGDDLPGYATRLYDAYLEDPELIRLATWARLERVPEGDLFAHVEGHYADKLAVIAQAQRDGRIAADLTPLDLHSMVIALAMTWSPASITIAAGRQEDESVHTRRKQALAATVRRAFAP